MGFSDRIGLTNPHKRTASTILDSTTHSPLSRASTGAPSRDKEARIREWTFPKAKSSPSASPNPGNPPSPTPSRLLTSPLAGTSSSSSSPASPGPAPGGGGGALSTARLNAKSASAKTSQVVYGLLFLGSLVVFFSALTGSGYDPALYADADDPLARTPAPPRGKGWPSSRAKAPEQLVPQGNVHVDIPQAFQPAAADAAQAQEVLRKKAPTWAIVEPAPVDDDDGGDDVEEDDAPPADLHHPNGDSSHDTGREFLRASPNDPALDVAQSHEEHPPNHPRPLFHAHGDDAGEHVALKRNGHVHADDHEEEERIVQQWAAGGGADPAPGEDDDDDENRQDETFVVEGAAEVVDVYDGAKEPSNPDDIIGSTLRGKSTDPLSDSLEDDGEDDDDDDDDDDDEDDDDDDDEEEENKAGDEATVSDAELSEADLEDLEREPHATPEELKAAKQALARSKKEREEQRERWVANVRQGRGNGRGREVR